MRKWPVQIYPGTFAPTSPRELVYSVCGRGLPAVVQCNSELLKRHNSRKGTRKNRIERFTWRPRDLVLLLRVASSPFMRIPGQI